MKRFFEIVVHHPRIILILFAVLTVFFLVQIPRIPIETDLKKWLPEGHPEVEFYDEMRDLFGFTSRVVIAVASDEPGGIYNTQVLQLVTELTEGIRGQEGVLDEDIISLATQDNIIGTEEGLEVVPFMEEVPSTPEALAALRSAVHANDMYYGTLVSKDDRATLILAEYADGVDKVALYRQVRSLIEAQRSRYPEERIYYAGRPILEGAMQQEVLEDMRVMLPIVIVSVLVLLALTLRTIRGVVLPFATVIISTIWTLGTMALIHSPLYSMSTMVPVILTAIGCAYGIHIISRYYDAVKSDDTRPRREIVLETMMEMWSPVVMTALTTVVGFLSMTVSQSLPPRSVGVFTLVFGSTSEAFRILFELFRPMPNMYVRPISTLFSLGRSTPKMRATVFLHLLGAALHGFPRPNLAAACVSG